MAHSERNLTTSDGIDLFTQTWSPKGAVKASVVIVHGYLEHGGRYAEVATYLTTKGMSVTVYDVRGHGKSSGVKAYVKSFDDYSNDMELVLEDVLKTSKAPLFVLAHSNGGLIALNHYLGKQQPVAQTRISGLIVTSPFLGPADELSIVKVWASKILGTLVPKLSLPADEVTSDILTHDPELREAHAKDELNLKNFTLGWAKVGMQIQKKVSNAESKTFDMPVLFMYAGDDKVANPEKNKVFAEALEAADKTVVEKEGEYHEILNEVNRKVTFETVSKWIMDHI